MYRFEVVIYGKKCELAIDAAWDGYGPVLVKGDEIGVEFILEWLDGACGYTGHILGREYVMPADLHRALGVAKPVISGIFSWKLVEGEPGHLELPPEGTL